MKYGWTRVCWEKFNFKGFRVLRKQCKATRCKVDLSSMIGSMSQPILMYPIRLLGNNLDIRCSEQVCTPTNVYFISTERVQGWKCLIVWEILKRHPLMPHARSSFCNIWVYTSSIIGYLKYEGMLTRTNEEENDGKEKVFTTSSHCLLLAMELQVPSWLGLQYSMETVGRHFCSASDWSWRGDRKLLPFLCLLW